MSRSVNRILAGPRRGTSTTVTGMVRAYDRPFLSSLDLKAVGPEINTEILYKAQILRARIVEIPAHLDWSGQTERIEKRRRPRSGSRTPPRCSSSRRSCSVRWSSS